MIRFQHVSKRYEPGHDALRGVNFHLRAGEFCFLTGHSGAGKTTLMRLILAMEKPTRGNITIGGIQLHQLSRRNIPAFRRGIGVVFQDNKLLFDRSVSENVGLPLLVSGIHHRDIQRRVRAALDKVGLLKKETHNPQVLSGGEKQRVGIARAIINLPNILIADEPTGNLDDDMSTQIMELFRDFNQHRVTVLIATHDLRQLKQFPGSRHLLLNDGLLHSEAVKNV